MPDWYMLLENRRDRSIWEPEAQWTRLELVWSGGCVVMDRFVVVVLGCGEWLGATVWSVDDAGGMTALREWVG